MSLLTVYICNTLFLSCFLSGQFIFHIHFLVFLSAAFLILVLPLTLILTLISIPLCDTHKHRQSHRVCNRTAPKKSPVNLVCKRHAETSNTQTSVLEKERNRGPGKNMCVSVRKNEKDSKSNLIRTDLHRYTHALRHTLPSSLELLHMRLSKNVCTHFICSFWEKCDRHCSYFNFY